jgi:hypothetical protein
MKWIENGVPSAGLYVGGLSWMASTQANYGLVPVVCAHNGTWIVPALCLSLAVVSILGGVLSWRALRPQFLPDHPGGGTPRRFTAMLGILSAALFAVVILVQGAAGMVLQGCER